MLDNFSGKCFVNFNSSSDKYVYKTASKLRLCRLVQDWVHEQLTPRGESCNGSTLTWLPWEINEISGHIDCYQLLHLVAHQFLSAWFVQLVSSNGQQMPSLDEVTNFDFSAASSSIVFTRSIALGSINFSATIRDFCDKQFCAQIGTMLIQSLIKATLDNNNLFSSLILSKKLSGV